MVLNIRYILCNVGNCDKGPVNSYKEGGGKWEGVQVRFYPYNKKGGMETVLAMLKGGGT